MSPHLGKNFPPSEQKLAEFNLETNNADNTVKEILPEIQNTISEDTKILENRPSNDFLLPDIKETMTREKFNLPTTENQQILTTHLERALENQNYNLDIIKFPLTANTAQEPHECLEISFTPYDANNDAEEKNERYNVDIDFDEVLNKKAISQSARAVVQASEVGVVIGQPATGVRPQRNDTFFKINILSIIAFCMILATIITFGAVFGNWI